MSLPLLVIITGPACTGKTSLGLRLSEECGLPFFYKDGFKEMMYDVIMEGEGIEAITQDVTKMLGKISIRCLHIVLEAMLAREKSLIVEANFDSRLFTPFLVRLQQQFHFQLVQVQLKCEGTALLNRFVERERTNRHPGHQGLTYLDYIRPTLLRGEQEPLAVAGELFVYDTTEFAALDYQPLFVYVNQRLRPDA